MRNGSVDERDESVITIIRIRQSDSVLTSNKIKIRMIETNELIMYLKRFVEIGNFKFILWMLASKCQQLLNAVNAMILR